MATSVHSLGTPQQTVPQTENCEPIQSLEMLAEQIVTLIENNVDAALLEEKVQLQVPVLCSMDAIDIFVKKIENALAHSEEKQKLAYSILTQKIQDMSERSGIQCPNSGIDRLLQYVFADWKKRKLLGVEVFKIFSKKHMKELIHWFLDANIQAETTRIEKRVEKRVQKCLKFDVVDLAFY